MNLNTVTARVAPFTQPFADMTSFLSADIPLEQITASYIANGQSSFVIRSETGPIVQSNGQRWEPDWRARPSQPRATIQHKISASFGGIFYDVITVTGGPHVVRKKLGPEATPANLGLTTRRTARKAAQLFGVPVAFNADRASAPNGDPFDTSNDNICRGLQIADGIAYRDFQTGTSQDEAFVMMRDGTHRVARIADGKTAQQWVDEGALWTTGGFAFLVIDGVPQDVSADPSIVDISARTIFGRRANGDFVFLVVEGITGSYGIGGQDMVTLAVSEGMDIAVVLDGGGSSQCWWSNTYAVPSSDSTEVSPPDPLDSGRRVAGWLVVDVPSVDPYDSGVLPLATVAQLGAGIIANLPQMWLHQNGPVITLNFNAVPSPALPNNADTALLTTNMRPRYFSAGTQALVGFARGNASGVGAIAFPVPMVVSGVGQFTARPGNAGAPGPAAVAGLYGNYSWRARWS